TEYAFRIVVRYVKVAVRPEDQAQRPAHAAAAGRDERAEVGAGGPVVARDLAAAADACRGVQVAGRAKEYPPAPRQVAPALRDADVKESAGGAAVTEDVPAGRPADVEVAIRPEGQLGRFVQAATARGDERAGCQRLGRGRAVAAGVVLGVERGLEGV